MLGVLCLNGKGCKKNNCFVKVIPEQFFFQGLWNYCQMNLIFFLAPPSSSLWVIYGKKRPRVESVGQWSEGKSGKKRQSLFVALGTISITILCSIMALYTIITRLLLLQNHWETTFYYIISQILNIFHLYRVPVPKCRVSCLERPWSSSGSSGGTVTIFIVILDSSTTSLFPLFFFRISFPTSIRTFYWSPLPPA